MTSGLGQCIAEMIASEIFNEREADTVDKIYGAVTTGSTWKFLEYRKGTARIDRPEYYIANVNKIIGIFVKMVRQET